MSRHKFVKELNNKITKTQNVDDEFDYYDEDEEEESNDPEAEERRMQEALKEARDTLGSEFTDTEIRDSLWHYYYDVEKTVNYLLKQKTASQNKLTPKKQKGYSAQQDADGGGVEPVIPHRGSCSRPISVEDFFKDCPWLNIPQDRRGEIRVEPLYPRGGLLGGASQDSGKPSKLAALAAARKKKLENDKAAAEKNSSGSSSIAILDKLNSKQKQGVGEDTAEGSTTRSATNATAPPKARKYPVRTKKQPEPEPVVKIKEEVREEPPIQQVDELGLKAPVLTSPSTFAQTILGSSPLAQDIPEEPDTPFSPSIRYNVFPEELAEDPFAGPSPDDVVAKAQSGSKGLKSAKQSSQKSKPVDEVTKELNKAKIDDAPQAKSKNLNVLAEYEKTKKKNAANFVVIGHVDAGKSTLMGRLLYDLKVIDERTIEQYKREAEKVGKSSFHLAWVLDSGSDERAHGVTIDIAERRFETPSTSFTILDAPGHQDFVPNMIAGAAQADFAVLVVDASTGSFESGLKGQTKEHAYLVRSIGVQRMIVAVNKLDSVNWSHERYTEISQQVSAFLLAAGFKESDISFVPCAGLTGDNITRRTTASSASWYTGQILLEQLDASATPRTHSISGPFRMPISDIFSGGVQYPLSTSGRLTSGSVQVGDRIMISPQQTAGFIRAIQVDDEPVDWAVAGMNATLHLSHIAADHLKTGDVICNPGAPLEPKTSFVLKALAFEHVMPMYVSVIVGRMNVEGRIEAMLATLDKSTGEVKKKKPKVLEPGSMARLRVVTDEGGGLPIESGQRVVLRAQGLTIATGLVE